MERSTHGVKEVSRILKAVPIVVYGEGEAVVDCLLEERAGTGAGQNPGGSSEPAWKADRGARGAEWPLSKLPLPGGWRTAQEGEVSPGLRNSTLLPTC